MATEICDIAVVGGGPAGLNAAIAAAEAGARTVLFDERPRPAPDRPDSEGRDALRIQATAAGVDLRHDSIVWGLFAGLRLAVLSRGESSDIGSAAVVLATGSITVTDPSPGWTQPDTRLALMAECAAGYSAQLVGWVPGRTRYLETSIPGVFVAGDGGGLCPGPDIAAAEGRLAGTSAALGLGFGSVTRRNDAAEELGRIAPDRLAEVANVNAWYVQGSHTDIPAAESYSNTPSRAGSAVRTTMSGSWSARAKASGNPRSWTPSPRVRAA